MRTVVHQLENVIWGEGAKKQTSEKIHNPIPSTAQKSKVEFKPSPKVVDKIEPKLELTLQAPVVEPKTSELKPKSDSKAKKETKLVVEPKPKPAIRISVPQPEIKPAFHEPALSSRTEALAEESLPSESDPRFKEF